MVGASRLSERYHLQELIARGGMGSVYAARDERLDRRVAVKLLKDELAADPSFVERFRREARAVASLVHPNIANVFDYGEDGGSYYIVMELARGRDLAHVLREEGALGPERSTAIAIQVCDALGYAHAAGVVHRDIKPANVIVSDDDHVKVTDFGIARAAGDATLTTAGSVLGTAQYISPEQASDGAVGPPSDVYSMGVVLYEMLTGEVPFYSDSPIALAMRHVSEDVPPPSRVAPQVPPHLDEVVARATAKAPEQRYASGADMAAALRGRAHTAPATAVMGAGAATAVLTGAAVPPRATDEIAPVTHRARGASVLGRIVGAALVLVLLLTAGLLALTLLAQDEGDAGDRRRRPGAGQPQEEASPTPEPETVTVPDGLVGSNVSDAEGVLRDAGLEPARQDVASDEDKDIVVDTRPVEGAEVSPGDVVTLFVSLGPEEGEGGDGEGEGGEGEGEGGEGEGEGGGPPGEPEGPPGEGERGNEGDD